MLNTPAENKKAGFSTEEKTSSFFDTEYLKADLKDDISGETRGIRSAAWDFPDRGLRIDLATGTADANGFALDMPLDPNSTKSLRMKGNVAIERAALDGLIGEEIQRQERARREQIVREPATSGDRMQIAVIADIWVAEGARCGVTADRVADAIVDAVCAGEFEFTLERDWRHDDGTILYKHPTGVAGGSCPQKSAVGVSQKCSNRVALDIFWGLLAAQ